MNNKTIDGVFCCDNCHTVFTIQTTEENLPTTTTCENCGQTQHPKQEYELSKQTGGDHITNPKTKEAILRHRLGDETYEALQTIQTTMDDLAKKYPKQKTKREITIITIATIITLANLIILKTTP